MSVCTKLYPLRLTVEDYSKLKQDSQNAGLTNSGYLRKLINQQQIKPKPPDSYSYLVLELSKIGNDINQIVYKANTAGTTTKKDAETAVFLLAKIIELMREMR
jgi:hypothetical protein